MYEATEAALCTTYFIKAMACYHGFSPASRRHQKGSLPSFSDEPPGRKAISVNDVDNAHFCVHAGDGCTKQQRPHCAPHILLKRWRVTVASRQPQGGAREDHFRASSMNRLGDKRRASMMSMTRISVCMQEMDVRSNRGRTAHNIFY